MAGLSAMSHTGEATANDGTDLRRLTAVLSPSLFRLFGELQFYESA